MRQSIIALIFSTLSGVATAEEFELIGAYDLVTQSVFGLSGIEVANDGQSFVAVGDRGWWATGIIERSGDEISNVQIDQIEPILGHDGFPVAARRVGDWSDAEGLAIAADGSVWVSFERWARVSRFDRPLTKARLINDHPSFFDYSDNWQLEAVAVDPQGQVYTFPEKPLVNGFPVYRLTTHGWTIDTYLPEYDLFSIVGADFDENGDLYLLERKLIVGLWWQNRIRRVRLDGSEDRALWTGERNQFGNLEGISLWRDDAGLRLTLVSDNNGKPDEPTEFVEFRLTH